MHATQQATPASTPHQALAHLPGNAWLHPSLAQHAVDHGIDYIQQDIEVHGFAISDQPTTPCGATVFGSGPDKIWVGMGGMEGRWMLPEEVLELSRALMLVAHAHIQRMYVKQCATLGIATAINAARAQAEGPAA